MPNTYFTLIIIGMFVVTFGIRFVLFASAHKAVMPKWLESGLKYVPVSVLTAIIAPMSVTDDSGLNLAISNPWFVGALTAFLVGLIFKHQLLTICVGVATFFITKLLTGN
ncbi:AzlD domain-containing protein [Marinomonas piezotolerans]|uniref:AzlD domain-containing protein n=1 Tax=Marinomonas piezotolerans TaxID=2213058 RepID=A0A370UE02_9GAMM|nr:AzlD domain-containing protein [Marinomonas piezotolerans]RDL46018.1 AzlD domain-containing protein [Marinomonas piezotolerans]